MDPLVRWLAPTKSDLARDKKLGLDKKKGILNDNVLDLTSLGLGVTAGGLGIASAFTSNTKTSGLLKSGAGLAKTLNSGLGFGRGINKQYKDRANAEKEYNALQKQIKDAKREPSEDEQKRLNALAKKKSKRRMAGSMIKSSISPTLGVVGGLLDTAAGIAKMTGNASVSKWLGVASGTVGATNGLAQAGIGGVDLFRALRHKGEPGQDVKAKGALTSILSGLVGAGASAMGLAAGFVGDKNTAMHLSRGAAVTGGVMAGGVPMFTKGIPLITKLLMGGNKNPSGQAQEAPQTEQGEQIEEAVEEEPEVQAGDGAVEEPEVQAGDGAVEEPETQTEEKVLDELEHV